jgi:hypothetical protein
MPVRLLKIHEFERWAFFLGIWSESQRVCNSDDSYMLPISTMLLSKLEITFLSSKDSWLCGNLSLVIPSLQVVEGFGGLFGGALRPCGNGHF